MQTTKCQLIDLNFNRSLREMKVVGSNLDGVVDVHRLRVLHTSTKQLSSAFSFTKVGLWLKLKNKSINSTIHIMHRPKFIHHHYHHTISLISFETP